MNKLLRPYLEIGLTDVADIVFVATYRMSLADVSHPRELGVGAIRPSTIEVSISPSGPRRAQRMSDRNEIFRPLPNKALTIPPI